MEDKGNMRVEHTFRSRDRYEGRVPGLVGNSIIEGERIVFSGRAHRAVTIDRAELWDSNDSILYVQRFERPVPMEAGDTLHIEFRMSFGAFPDEEEIVGAVVGFTIEVIV